MQGITKEHIRKVSFPQAKRVGNPSEKKDSGQAGMTSNGSLTCEPIIKSNNFKIINSQFSGGAGFTLIEVIVAVAILSVSLVMIMQLFAAGLKASRSSCDYTRAVMHAKDKMEELSAAPVKPQESGEFRDGYKWESYAETYKESPDEELENARFKLLKLKVKIMWNISANKDNSLELESLKMVSAEDANNL